MMSLFRNTIVGAAIGAGAFAFSVSNASAYIVCNDTSVCWHTHNPYDYPPEAHVTVHENEWHWGANEHYTSVSTLVGAIGAATIGSTGKRYLPQSAAPVGLI